MDCLSVCTALEASAMDDGRVVAVFFMVGGLDNLLSHLYIYMIHIYKHQQI